MSLAIRAKERALVADDLALLVLALAVVWPICRHAHIYAPVWYNKDSQNSRARGIMEVPLREARPEGVGKGKGRGEGARGKAEGEGCFIHIGVSIVLALC